MMHDPHLHIEPIDTAPWWILALLVAALVIAAPLWFISRVIDAVLSVQWPV